MSSTKHLYSYDGPVELAGKCVDQRWSAETYAVSKAKARSNFKYRYRMDNDLPYNASINLPGKIKED